MTCHGSSPTLIVRVTVFFAALITATAPESVAVT
jgi:hypothetical protein